MKQYIRQIYLCCLLLLSVGAGAQEVVGPDGPDSPSTGNKTITVIQAAGGNMMVLVFLCSKKNNNL